MKALGDNHPEVAKSYNHIGKIYLRKGDLDAALKEYQKAQSIRIMVLGRDHIETAETYNNIGLVLYIQ